MDKVLNFLKNPIFITMLIIAIGIGGLIGLLTLFPDNAASSAKYVERSWGVQDSKATVTIYGDFQCSACRSYYTTVEQPLKTQYSDKIKFVFKHYPLTSIHRNAQKASEAAEAAGTQGKFWEYHDLLYSASQTESDTWNTDAYVRYATELGLDITKFKQELADNTYRQVVKDSVNEANSKEYTGTPTVEINGKKFEGQGGVPTLEEIQSEIAKVLGTTVTPTATPAQ
jgi:formate-nitrite transporter family protein